MTVNDRLSNVLGLGVSRFNLWSRSMLSFILSSDGAAKMITDDYTGIGFYQVPDVARYLGAKPDDVRRWAFGYERRGMQYRPAIVTELPVLGRHRALTFLELVELMFIKGLLEAGKSWPKVREASRVAARLLKAEHPFAMEALFSDPAGIYLELARKHDEPIFVELVGDGQVTMKRTLRPYLKQLDFNIQGQAERWFPLGKDQLVVLDPARSFGSPIVREGGVRTELISDMHEAGDSNGSIARWFGITEAEVQSALLFQNKLAA